MRSACAIAALLLLLPLAATAQELTVTVDRTVVSSDGDPFYLTVKASGRRVGDPKIPNADGVYIKPTPFSRSSNTTVQFGLNGSNMVTNNVWTYEAKTRREGTLTIPPITVTIDGKKVASEPITIQAVKPSSPTVPQSGSEKTGGQSSTSGPGARQPTIDDAALVRTEVSSREVYVGEAVELKLKLYELDSPGVMLRYAGGPSLPAPSTEGFYAVPQLPQELPDAREKLNGFSYRVQSWGQRLFPTRSGELTIGAWHWMGSLRAHTRSGPMNRRIDRKTDPIVITVRELPDPPSGFSGAVGQFTCAARMEDRALTQGVPALLTFTVNGQGNPDGIGAPNLPDLPWAQANGPMIDVRVLKDQRGVETGIEKSFTYDITPIEAGDYSIPKFDYTYFMPAMGQYKTVSTNAIPVTVEKSSESAVLIASGGALEGTPATIKVLGSDIRTIITTPRGLETRRSSLPANLAFGVVPPVSFAFMALFIQRRKRLTEDTGYARKYYAHSKNRKRLAAIPSSASPTEALFSAVVGYVADTFNANAAGMTSGDARTIMLENGMPAEIIDTAVKVLKSCERAHYGGAELSANEISALTDAAGSMMDRSDAFIKKGRI